MKPYFFLSFGILSLGVDSDCLAQGAPAPPPVVWEFNSEIGQDGWNGLFDSWHHWKGSPISKTTLNEAGGWSIKASFGDWRDNWTKETGFPSSASMEGSFTPTRLDWSATLAAEHWNATSVFEQLWGTVQISAWIRGEPGTTYSFTIEHHGSWNACLNKAMVSFSGSQVAASTDASGCTTLPLSVITTQTLQSVGPVRYFTEFPLQPYSKAVFSGQSGSPTWTTETAGLDAYAAVLCAMLCGSPVLVDATGELHSSVEIQLCSDPNSNCCSLCCPVDAEEQKWDGCSTARNCKTNNLCYNYARNRQDGDRKQPGGGGYLESDISCETIMSAAERDGLFPAPSSECPLCYCPVALWVRRWWLLHLEGWRPDFHWWRKNLDGTWSSKSSTGPVGIHGTEDPPPGGIHEKLVYSFCGFMCAPCGDAPYAPQEAQMEQQESTDSNGQVSITPRIFSGRIDPTFVLDQGDVSDRLQQLASGLTATAIDPATVLPLGLGYHGFDVTGLSTADNRGIISVFGSLAIVYGPSGPTVYSDSGELESALIAISIEKGTLPLDFYPVDGYLLDDLAKLVRCMPGGQPGADVQCTRWDFDQNGTTDLLDFAVFQLTYGAR